MQKSESIRSVVSAPGALNAIPQLKDFKFGEFQQGHARWLIDRCGEPIVWEDDGSIGRAEKLLIVTKPLTGPQVDLLCRSLQPDSVVVIPFGENPVFDFLKSKLVDYGIAAPSGADGPHQMWWGGLNGNGFGQATHAQPPLIVSGYPCDADTKDVDRLTNSLHALALDHVVEPIDGTTSERMAGIRKIKFILDMWEKTRRSILWVDPDAIFMRAPSLLETVECDIALHKWLGWEIATRTLYFGRSAAAEAVLRTWLRLTESFPAVWEGYLLDQAWSLVTSQMPLRTIWLPRGYHASHEDSMGGDTSVVVHNLSAGTRELSPSRDFPNPLRTARRAGRTGTPEPHLVMASSTGCHGAIVALIRDVHSADAHAVASAVEDVASAFVRDPGGFNQLELSLCRWNQDFKAALSVADREDAWVLVIDPAERVPESIFRDIGKRMETRPSNRIFRLPDRETGEVLYRGRSNIYALRGHLDAGRLRRPKRDGGGDGFRL